MAVIGREVISSSQVNGADIKLGVVYQNLSSVVIDRIEAYCDGLGTGSGGTQLKLAICQGLSGSESTIPDAVIVQIPTPPTIADGAAAAWVGCDITPITINAAYIWFAALANNTRMRMYYGAVTFGQAQYLTETYASGITGSWAGRSGDTVGLAIRARIQSVTLDNVLPDADVVTTGWTTAPLFSKVNDASDSTVIQATAV